MMIFNGTYFEPINPLIDLTSSSSESEEDDEPKRALRRVKSESYLFDIQAKKNKGKSIPVGDKHK
jgi:hypothetical protein